MLQTGQRLLQIQYEEGDKEVGAGLVKFDVELSSEGSQLVKVHEFTPGEYVLHASNLEDTDAPSAAAAREPALPDNNKTAGNPTCMLTADLSIFGL